MKKNIFFTTFIASILAVIATYAEIPTNATQSIAPSAKSEFEVKEEREYYNGIPVMTEAEREEERHQDAIHTFICAATFFGFIALIICMCTVWHYHELDKKFGNTLTKKEKKMLAITSMAAACAIGYKLGTSGFKKERSRSNG